MAPLEESAAPMMTIAMRAASLRALATLFLVATALGVVLPEAFPVPASATGGILAGLNSIACSSTSQCTTTGRYVVYTFNPIAPGMPAPVIDSGSLLLTAACPTSSQCTIVGGEGELTYDPAAPGALTPTTIDSHGDLGSVACPSTSQCTAIDNRSSEVTFDPTAPGMPAPSTIDTGLDSSGAPFGLVGLACPSTSQCTAIDNGGREITFDPTAPGNPTPNSIDTAGPLNGLVNQLVGLACPSTNQCTAVDSGGREITFDPTAPRTPTAVAIDGNNVTGGLACPSTTQCTAIGQASVASTGIPSFAGGEATFDPLAPGAPVPMAIATSGSLGALACPSVTQCTAIDNNGTDAGEEITFDPAAPETPTPVLISAIGTGASMGKAKVSATEATVAVTCLDYYDLSCTLTLQLSVVEVIRGRDVIAIRARQGMPQGTHPRRDSRPSDLQHRGGPDNRGNPHPERNRTTSAGRQSPLDRDSYAHALRNGPPCEPEPDLHGTRAWPSQDVGPALRSHPHERLNYPFRSAQTIRTCRARPPKAPCGAPPRTVKSGTLRCSHLLPATHATARRCARRVNAIRSLCGLARHTPRSTTSTRDRQ